MPIRPNVLSVQVPSAMNYTGQNDTSNAARDGSENGAESLVNPSKVINDISDLSISVLIFPVTQNYRFVNLFRNLRTTCSC